MLLSRLLALSLLLVALTDLASATQDGNRADAASATRWEQLLNWLPEDTETIIVAQGPLQVPKRDAGEFSFGESAPLLPAGPLVSLENGLLRNALPWQNVVCAVEGSRRFVSPGGLGLMPYQGCHIIEFDAACDGAVQKAFQTCQTKAEKQVQLGDAEVAVFTKKHDNDVWSYFVCRPKPGVLICATDRAYLEATLKRIGRKSEKRALPADLPEWKHVDLKARVWAVRHYRKESAQNDPSSPLRSKAPANVPDPAAVGFVFWYSPGADKVARARYISGAKDAVNLAAQGWNYPSEGLSPQITQVAPGVVEIVTSISEERTGRMYALVLLMHLGHGIYL
jgi:hypothetical protein